jgi:hypothetical protein
MGSVRGTGRAIARDAANVGWQRVIVTAVVTTGFVVILDYFGTINWLASFIPGEW